MAAVWALIATILLAHLTICMAIFAWHGWLLVFRLCCSPIMLSCTFLMQLVQYLLILPAATETTVKETKGADHHNQHVIEQV